MQSLRSLIITTSNGKGEDMDKKTGIWMEDLAAPYFILKEGGEDITIVSSLGGPIPVNPDYGSAKDSALRFDKDPQAMYRLRHTLPLDKVRKEDFDLVFVIGGCCAIRDFPEDKQLQYLTSYFIRQQIPIGFVGYALAAMILLTRYDGRPLLQGRRITAYSNLEEEQALWPAKPFFLLESKLIELGAIYGKGPAGAGHVVTDRSIVTGQNPASAIETAERLLLLAQNKERDIQLLMEEKIY